jgi:hypothetical protein
VRDKKTTLTEVKDLITAFAEKNLSSEEKAICIHIWEKLARKQKIDLTRTKSNIWAAATIWAFCRANFKYEEGITLDKLCSFFDTKKSTVGNKASDICKMFKIDFFNPEFTTRRIQADNPLNEFAVTEDGFIVPRELSEHGMLASRMPSGEKIRKPVSADTVEETWRRMAAMSPEDAIKMAKLMQKQQPVVVTYLITVDSDILNQDERQLLFYLGVAVWQMMSQGGTCLPTVTEDMLISAEDRNVKMAEYLQGETEAGFVEATKTIINSYRQPEVLRYVIEALMEGEEEDGIIRDENKGIMMLDLKTVIDCFDT